MASDDKFALKNCPCCGGRATMEHGAERSDNGWVVCLECGLSTRYHKDPAEAAAEWNRRANETDALTPGNAAAMREALVKIYREVRSYCYDYGAGESHKSLVDRIVDDPPDYTSYRDSILEIDRIVDAAIAAPARNCDLPNTTERYNEFCYNHRDAETCCEKCPFNGSSDCDAAWLLAPAEEGGAE